MKIDRIKQPKKNLRVKYYSIHFIESIPFCETIQKINFTSNKSIL